MLSGPVHNRLAGERALQAGEDRGSAGRIGFAGFEDYHALRGPRGAALIVEDNRQMPGRDAVAGLQLQFGAQGDVVHQSAVLAPEILGSPVVAIAFQDHVLPRQAGIVRKAQFGGTGASNYKSVAL